jgi:tripartite-type tricarboxylate transporter receptor subunit TctC
VRIVVPYGPGGAVDVAARKVAQMLSTQTGQSFVVENKPGATGTIGVSQVARAPADGYTLVLANESLAINAALPRPLPFDTLRGFAAVSTVSMNPRVFVVIASSPYTSIRDFLAAARSKPGSIRYGSSGIGTGPHLAGALLSTMAKVELTHVPYKGAAPALADVVGGQIETIASTILSAQPLIQSGRARALAVTSTRRSEALPGVPTVAETIPGFEASSWSMVLGPAGVPRPILLRLHEEIARFLQQPEVRKRIAGDGGEPVGSSPDQAAAQLKSDVERWRRVIREAGVGAEG